MRRPVVLDTDIGTNVDDLWALLVLAGAPEVDLVGVVTVAGDTAVRAAVARHVLDLVGRADAPVLAGAGEPLSGRAPRWLGHEAAVLGDVPVPSAPDGATDATEWLLDRAAEHGGRLEVIAIGPLTNLATARRRDPARFAAIGRLHVMGGDRAGDLETNLSSDAVAADEVLRSGVDLVRCGLEVTRGARIDGRLLEHGLARSRGNQAVVDLIREESTRYWSIVGVDGSPAHDALAVLAALEPERFAFAPERVAVVADGRRAGALVDDPDALPTTAVTGYTPGTVGALLERICG